MLLLLPCFSFSPFVLFCGHAFSRKARPVISRRPAAGDLARPLAQVRARGLPYLGRRVGPLLLWVFDGLVCEPVGCRDPRTPRVQGRFSGKGAFFLPPHRPFFTLHVFFPPQVLFFCDKVEWRDEPQELLRVFPGTLRGVQPLDCKSESCPENSQNIRRES